MPLSQTRSQFNGSGHCGNVRYTLIWPLPQAHHLRTCSCSFCAKHAPIYMGHPSASIASTVRDLSALSRYTFGTRSADFRSCTLCGVFLFAICRIDGVEKAVLNVNTLDAFALPADVKQNNYEGEVIDGRLDRRLRTWIGHVEWLPTGE